MNNNFDLVVIYRRMEKKDVINYIRHLRCSHDEGKLKVVTEPYTLEELNMRVDQAEKNYAEGQYTNSSEVHKEITNLLASL